MNTQTIYLGQGCFWGAERRWWTTPGVLATRVGYQGGSTTYPSYRAVCNGSTGHVEVVEVSYDDAGLPTDALLRQFFETHDPTQGNRQGADVGNQYRSVIFCTTPAQAEAAQTVKNEYQTALAAAGYGQITTEIAAAPTFWPAEDYHQKYLAKNPDGYCGVGGCGVSFS